MHSGGWGGWAKVTRSQVPKDSVDDGVGLPSCNSVFQGAYRTITLWLCSVETHALAGIKHQSG